MQLLFTLVLLVSSTRAWWDLGHMLVAEIAHQQLTANETALVNDVLSDWSTDFPGASDLVSIAVWPDMIKCRSVSPFCRKPRPDALEFASNWHFDDQPYNPDNLTLTDIETQMWQGQPSASWLLTDAMGTFGESQTRFGFNLMLRFLVHILGDIHQPLHVVSGYFNDKRFGHLPRGDRGGNLIIVDTDAGFTNLHAFWDGAAGLYAEGNWPLDPTQQAQLRSNATALMAEYPKDSTAFNGRYMHGADVAHCWDPPPGVPFPDDCGGTFLQWVNDSYTLAEFTAYGPGVANGTKLSQSYVAAAQETSKSQITLAGYRLADVLKQVVPKLAALKPLARRQAALAPTREEALMIQVESLTRQVEQLKAQLATRNEGT